MHHPCNHHHHHHHHHHQHHHHRHHHGLQSFGIFFVKVKYATLVAMDLLFFFVISILCFAK
uniref:Uncharacterized protein n=1 Tax=Glossina pallidipes TaxID=7398 RepID=A0A1A9ZZV7_GLOPL